MERIATQAIEGDEAQMRAAVVELRALRAKIDRELTELEQVMTDFSTLDDLLD